MDTARERRSGAAVQGMNWGRLKPARNLHTWLLVLLSLTLLSLAAFKLGGEGIGMAVTGVLVFFLAFLSRTDETAARP